VLSSETKRVMTLRRIGLTGLVARIGVIRKRSRLYIKILVRKPEEFRQLGRTRCKWEGILKFILRKVIWVCVPNSCDSR
jgi:hypothetical protein